MGSTAATVASRELLAEAAAAVKALDQSLHCTDLCRMDSQQKDPGTPWISVDSAGAELLRATQEVVLAVLMRQIRLRKCSRSRSSPG